MVKVEKSLFFDLSCLSNKYSGTVTFALNLLKALHKRGIYPKIILNKNLSETFFAIILNDSEIDPRKMFVEKIQVPKMGLKREIFFSLIFIKSLLKFKKPHLICPTEKFPLIFWKGLITIHDCRGLERDFGNKFWDVSPIKKILYRRYITLAIRQASQIGCVSESTLQRLSSLINISNKNGIILSNVVSEPPINKLVEKKEKSVLCVSDFTKEHKNWKDTRTMLSKLKDMGFKIRIITNTNESLMKDFNRLGFEFYSNISEEKLKNFYSKSLIYLNMSYYEGFGIPLIEASNYGCFIICSDLQVFREILQNRKAYFIPKGTKLDDAGLKEIKQKINKLLSNNDSNYYPHNNYSHERLLVESKKIIL